MVLGFGLATNAAVEAGATVDSTKYVALVAKASPMAKLRTESFEPSRRDARFRMCYETAHKAADRRRLMKRIPVASQNTWCSASNRIMRMRLTQ